MEDGDRVGPTQGQSWEKVRSYQRCGRARVLGQPCSTHLLLPHPRTCTHEHPTCMLFTFPKIPGIEKVAASDKGYNGGLRNRPGVEQGTLSLNLLKLTSNYRATRMDFIVIQIY